MPGLTSTTPVRDRGPNAQLVFICTRTCSCDRGPYTKTAKVEYLPFTMVFVTGDRLQLRVAPLFLGDRTSLINAADLKTALKEMDEYYEQLPDEVKAQGVMSFAGGYPPPSMDNTVTQLWDKHMRPDWRDIQRSKDEGKPNGPPSKTVKEMIDEIEKSTPIAPGEPGFGAADNPDVMTLERRMFVHRGKWRMVSKEVEEAGDKSRAKSDDDS